MFFYFQYRLSQYVWGKRRNYIHFWVSVACTKNQTGNLPQTKACLLFLAIWDKLFPNFPKLLQQLWNIKTTGLFAETSGNGYWICSMHPDSSMLRNNKATFQCFLHLTQLELWQKFALFLHLRICSFLERIWTMWDNTSKCSFFQGVLEEAACYISDNRVFQHSKRLYHLLNSLFWEAIFKSLPRNMNLFVASSASGEQVVC